MLRQSQASNTTNGNGNTSPTNPKVVELSTALRPSLAFPSCFFAADEFLCGCFRQLCIQCHSCTVIELSVADQEVTKLLFFLVGKLAGDLCRVSIRTSDTSSTLFNAPSQ